MNTVLRFPLSALLAWLLTAATASAVERAAFNAALDSIANDELKQHVDALADDQFEGREAGSRGGRAAGLYLGKQFQQLELKGGAPDGGYYQPFEPQCRNILALIEGSDPELKDQLVVVGAHYDHVGYGTRRNSHGPIGYIHNGADDNASGAAALVEVAEAFVQLGEPPRRSILFALWDGEEKGLWGSKHWLDNPTRPLKQVPIMINMDMVGRLRDGRIDVYGTRTAFGLRRLVSQQNNEPGVRLVFNWEMKENSDHFPFYSRNIPILMLHTGLHSDYHRPSDDAEKINIDGMREVSRLLFGIVYELANAAELPKFRRASRQESPYTQTQIEQPLAQLPGRLGVRWDIKESGPGVRVMETVFGSAADRAGLRAGDRITKLGDADIESTDQLRSLVLAEPRKTTVTIERPNEKEPRELPIELTGEPVRIGITWRADDAEPGTVALNRVVPGSAADRAGLRVHDRIYAVGDREFTTSDEFKDLITTASGPVDLKIERRGRVQTVTLELPTS